jgi:hypothetical protein
MIARIEGEERLAKFPGIRHQCVGGKRGEVAAQSLLRCLPHRVHEADCRIEALAIEIFQLLNMKVKKHKQQSSVGFVRTPGCIHKHEPEREDA